jgi:hypothetical protein
MNLLLYIFPLIISKLLFPGVYGSGSEKTHEDWSLIKDKNGIKVYLHKEPKTFASIKIHAKVQANLQTFIDFTHDVEKYPDWNNSCAQATELSSTGNVLEYSTITDMPFPMSDRKLTLRSTHQIYSNYYEAFSYAIPSKNPNNEYVVIPYFNGEWKVHQIDHNTITIDYKVETEPGGMIPRWIYNLGVDVGPYKTMYTLKKRLESIQQI